MTGTKSTLQAVAAAMLRTLDRLLASPPVQAHAQRLQQSAATPEHPGEHPPDKPPEHPPDKPPAAPPEALFNVESVALSQSRECPWHDLPLPESLVSLPRGVPIRDFLLSGPSPGSLLQLAWPHCLEARCRACGGGCTPFRRVAFVRRRAPCPRCAAVGQLEPLAAISELSATDPAALYTPEQLNLPADDLYELREAVVWFGTGEQH